MRYSFAMEAIGDGFSHDRRQFERLRGTRVAERKGLRRELEAMRLGGRHVTPWVARLVGLSASGHLEREFVRPNRDHSRASSTGNRGLWLYYALEPGLYEINERLTWRRVRRYFARVVDEHSMIEITREEAERCLPLR